MTIKTIIVEDELKNIKVLEELISKYAFGLQVCGTAGHVDKAVELIESTSPDLLFMDVRLADGSSFEILRKLSKRQFELIFVTAYEDYALDAFKFAAIDYLLKPIGIPEFQEAIGRARKKLSEKKTYTDINSLLHQMALHNEHDKKIKIATVHGYEFVDVSSIIWCKSEGHYTTFYVTNKTRLTSSKNMGYFEEQLASYNFCRINHNIMINMQYIKSYMKGKGGYVVMNDGTELEISQRRKADFLNKLSH
jgi:two-component system, LytTR family, response regulator